MKIREKWSNRSYGKLVIENSVKINGKKVWKTNWKRDIEDGNREKNGKGELLKKKEILKWIENGM